ncbi:A/G-specific adenine glycosylase [Clostridia bacterium]|nr:A/G-specific adenine glycosylase [Clostridia bacterium]
MKVFGKGAEGLFSKKGFPQEKPFFSALIAWFEGHARALPWRNDRAPYGVWVSEVMLQQTRATVAADYYVQFMRALPDVRALAAADEQDLFKLWEGLGYYSRARNLQKAARIIVERYGGALPCAYEHLLELPGIGDYTAGAVASICFNLPTPAVDGNVLRVLARVLNRPWTAGDTAARAAASDILKPVYGAAERRGILTEALMELGAVVCVPRNPRCGECPVREACAAYKAGTAAALPLKKAKPQKPATELTVFILIRKGQDGDREGKEDERNGGKENAENDGEGNTEIAVRKRGENGLLKGLWEFPNVQGFLSEREAFRKIEEWGCRPSELLRSTRRKHEFTHRIWNMTGYYIECTMRREECRTNATFVWAEQERLEKEIPLPSAFKPFLSI